MSINGSISNMTSLTYLNIFEGNNTLYGSISNLKQISYLNVKGMNTLSGSISTLDELRYLNIKGHNTISGDLCNLYDLQYAIIDSLSGTNQIGCSSAINLVDLCLLQFHHGSTVFTSENVSQILADFWANRDCPKPRAERIIYLVGKPGTESPTEQGLIDKANLAAYKSPNNTGSTFWTVTTR
jgi:hypothetical protein